MTFWWPFQINQNLEIKGLQETIAQISGTNVLKSAISMLYFFNNYLLTDFNNCLKITIGTKKEQTLYIVRFLMCFVPEESEE